MSVAWDNSTYLWLAQVLFLTRIVIVVITAIVIIIVVLINLTIIIVIIPDRGDGLFSKQQLSISGKTSIMADKLDAG